MHTYFDFHLDPKDDSTCDHCDIQDSYCLKKASCAARMADGNSERQDVAAATEHSEGGRNKMSAGTSFTPPAPTRWQKRVTQQDSTMAPEPAPPPRPDPTHQPRPPACSANWLCVCALELAVCGACGRGWAQTQAQAETGAA